MKNPVKIFHWAYIPVALVLISVTIYYAKFAHFCKEDNFSKDINIRLPEYTIAEKQMIEPLDVWIWESYDSLSYTLALPEPLSDAECKAITSERRGWKHVKDNKYKLYRDIIAENVSCTYEIGSRSILIEYRYNYYNNTTFVFVVILALAIIYYILLIIIGTVSYIKMIKLAKRKEAEGSNPRPESRILLSIILFMMFWPLGLYALISSFGILQSYLNDDYEKASHKSEFLRKFCIAGIIAVLVLGIVFTIIDFHIFSQS